MILPFFIAKRYLFGKKSKNVINYISAISVIVVAVVTMALFVALSVFNGLQGLIKTMYDSFDSDLKISAVSGKVFVPDARFAEIKTIPGVISYSEVIEEDVLLKYADKQFIGRLKGVSDSYAQTTGINKNIVSGQYFMRDSSVEYCITGQGLAYYLTIGLQVVEPIQVYVPSRKAKAMSAPDKSYKHASMYPVGIFQTQQDIDSRYVICSLPFARNLLEYTNEVGAVELKVDTTQIDDIKESIKSKLGDAFYIKNKDEQHEFVYKVLRSEKWGIFLIVTFILLIASFNVVGVLTMLIIDKSKDIEIIKSMGASKRILKQIFLFEGWMISLLGAIIGLGLGVLLCWLQSHFHLLKFAEDGSFIVDAYPVQMQFTDAINVFLVVAAIGFIAAYIPVRQISKK